MATAEQQTIQAPRFLGLPETQGTRLFLLAGAAAAVIAVMAVVWMWSYQPEYRVLFSNYSNRDGGAIVGVLQQMNVPYKFADGGTAILVPENQVHDVRLKLAAQGLPKGGNIGFELMENQKMGISQFLEKINFQRALEGELARSIESISAVQTARVHLAIPKDSVFIRDQQKPTASVILNLYSNRLLDGQQVRAVVHLVASSVPDLPAQNVTVVDQNGNLLSDPTKPPASGQLNPTQLKYVQELQRDIVKRIESIITPIVGPNNVRAEATADVDFTHVQQAAETYKPNHNPDTTSVRSMQSNEVGNKAAANASGIPGALSNQPPANATAPLTTTTTASNGAASTNPVSSAPIQKEETINYELDKTVRYTQQAVGGIKRLAVAVVVNYKQEVDKSGKAVNRALTDAEKAQITSLAKEAMGFSQDRGDSLNVVNSQFIVPKEEAAEVPFWKQADTINFAINILKYIVGAAALLYLFFAYLKPLLKKIMDRSASRSTSDGGASDDSVVTLSNGESSGRSQANPAQAYEKDLAAAQHMAKQDPKVVANVVKSWVNEDGKG